MSPAPAELEAMKMTTGMADLKPASPIDKNSSTAPFVLVSNNLSSNLYTCTEKSNGSAIF